MSNDIDHSNNSGESWFLTISTWKGITPWADHFYGLIQINPESEDKKEIHVKRAMHYKEIINGNKKEGWRIYRVGDFTESFSSREELIEQAIRTFTEMAPVKSSLYSGLWYGEPELITTK